MPHTLTTVSHGRLPREHLLPTSLGMKLPYSVPKRQFWVGGRERSQPRSQGLTAALPWPRPQSLPSVAVIRLVIPVRVPPALKHEGTAAQTMELGRASATPRRPLPRRGGTEAAQEPCPSLWAEPGGSPAVTVGEPAGRRFPETAAGAAATTQVTEKGHSSGTSCGQTLARLPHNQWARPGATGPCWCTRVTSPLLRLRGRRAPQHRPPILVPIQAAVARPAPASLSFHSPCL